MDGHTILVERELYIYMYIYLYCSSFDYAATLDFLFSVLVEWGGGVVDGISQQAES